jgi:hypothetical protein
LMPPPPYLFDGLSARPGVKAVDHNVTGGPAAQNLTQNCSCLLISLLKVLGFQEGFSFEVTDQCKPSRFLVY